MKEPLLKVENLAVRIGANQLLHDVDFEICPAEIVTVIGPNGAGKSTLLKAIIGALPVSGGTVTKKPGLRIGCTP